MKNKYITYQYRKYNSYNIAILIKQSCICDTSILELNYFLYCVKYCNILENLVLPLSKIGLPLPRLNV